MGEIVAFKRCQYSGNGLCLATSILSCVCYRGGQSKMLVVTGRAPRRPKPSFPILGLGMDAGSICDPGSQGTIIEITAALADQPAPWMLPRDDADLITFAKSGGPIIDDFNDVGC